jgi:hypothetical protein
LKQFHSDPRFAESREHLEELLARGPLLIQVRLPGLGATAEWILTSEYEEVAELASRLSPGAELHVSSVLDLRDAEGPATFTIGSPS